MFVSKKRIRKRKRIIVNKYQVRNLMIIFCLCLKGKNCQLSKRRRIKRKSCKRKKTVGVKNKTHIKR